MSKLKKHYLDYIQEHPDTAKLYIKWNWSAFFFGPLWLFYRNMFLYGFIYFAIFLVMIVINFVLFPEHEISIMLIVNILLGMYGTALFCNKCRKEVLKKNSVEKEYNDSKTTIDNFICKTRPIIAVFLYIISVIICIAVFVYMAHKTSPAQNLTKNYIHEDTKFNNFKLTTNDSEIFYDIEFETIKEKLKKIEIGKEKHAVLENPKKQFMQMHLDRQENGIKYYHIEYKLSPGKILYITYKEKIPEEQMISLFYKFYQGDISFTSDIRWSPLNFISKEILDIEYNNK